MADDRWLPRARRTGEGRVVICFAPAGAGAGFFRDWGAALPDCRLMPVQLPGREERFAETAIDEAMAIAGYAADAIAGDDEADAPVLLGYSYGALLAFETAHALESQGRPVAGVVCCARSAPQDKPRASVAEMDDEALLDYVAALGGLPDEVLRDREFAALVLPVLRADFRANDYYASSRDRRIDAPVTVVVGQEDTRVRAAMDAGATPGWQERTRGAFAECDVPGGHFFVLDRPDAAFAAIHRALGLKVAA